MKVFKRLAALAGASGFIAALSLAPVAAYGSHHDHGHGRHGRKSNTVVVTPDNLKLPSDVTTPQKNWYFWNDNTDVGSTDELPGTYEFVGNNGSDSDGSVAFNLGDNGERWNLATNQLAGQRLKKLKKLSFDMYTPSSSAGGDATTLFLNFDVDFDNTTDTGYQGRLVYVPQQNRTPALDTWETWETIDDGNGVWWWSRYASNGNEWLDGSTDEYRTWEDIMDAFPNAEVFNEGFTGNFLIRAGHPGPDGLQGNVDNIAFKTKYKKIKYDFEEAPATVHNFEFTQDELDNNWDGDRRFPTDGATSVSAFGRDNVARLGLDSSQTDPSNDFRRTEGIKTIPAEGDFGNAVEVDLYLDPDWADKAVRAGLWVVGDDGAGARDNFFGIIEFVNSEPCPDTDCSNQGNITDHEGFRIWDSTVGWSAELDTDFDYGEWVTLKIELDEDAEQYKYFIDDEEVGTAAAGNQFIREVFLNSYNYGQDAFPNLNSDSYAAYWHGGGETAVQAKGKIKSPRVDSYVDKKLKLKAKYYDGDRENDDIVQWAVRFETCDMGTNTVLGNVDGFDDDYRWDGHRFSASFRTKDLDPGQYCFVFNPKDDPGQGDVRETRMFYIAPQEREDCEDDAWQQLGFDSERDCKKYVKKHNHHGRRHEDRGRRHGRSFWRKVASYCRSFFD